MDRYFNIENVGQAINAVAELLKETSETPRLDARIIVAHVLNTEPAKIFAYPEIALTEKDIEEIKNMTGRRMKHEPVSKITGKKEFWSIVFDVTKDTLDPRPDSETLIEAVLCNIKDKKSPIDILDLGTGTGCLLLSILSELPNATGTGIDISEKAVKVAEKNAEKLGMSGRCEIKNESWEDFKSDKKFDVIISNPPYIKATDIKELLLDVSLYDPEEALNGGNDGLAAYRSLSANVGKFLKQDGFLAVEIGLGQEEEVKNIFIKAGYSHIFTSKDLSGVPRCIIFAV